jgi:GNAT acetyltransferase-like protein
LPPTRRHEGPASDRAAVIELFASPEVRTYIGGPGRVTSSSARCPGAPRRRPGLFVVDLDGAMIGMVTLDRRGAERPGDVRLDAGQAGLGRMFLPQARGCRYAAEACAAANRMS